MEIELKPEEKIKIKSVGKYPSILNVWIDKDGCINYSGKDTTGEKIKH